MRRPGSHRPSSYRLGKKYYNYGPIKYHVRIKIDTRRFELDCVLKLLLECLTSRKPISLIAELLGIQRSFFCCFLNTVYAFILNLYSISNRSRRPVWIIILLHPLKRT